MPRPQEGQVAKVQECGACPESGWVLGHGWLRVGGSVQQKVPQDQQVHIHCGGLWGPRPCSNSSSWHLDTIQEDWQVAQTMQGWGGSEQAEEAVSHPRLTRCLPQVQFDALFREALEAEFPCARAFGGSLIPRLDGWSTPCRRSWQVALQKVEEQTLDCVGGSRTAVAAPHP